MNNLSPLVLSIVLLSFAAAAAAQESPAARLAPEGAAVLPLAGADYQFASDLKSTIHGVPDLQDLGPGTNSFVTEKVFSSTHPVLSFPKGNGVLLNPVSSVFSGDVYSIETVFRQTAKSGYSRVLDFENAASDCGVYMYNGVVRLFCSLTDGPGVVPGGTWIRMIVTRDGLGIVKAYLDGDLQFAFDDTTLKHETIHGDTLRFFRDNDCASGPCNEDTDGAVSRIRIWAGLDIGQENIAQMETCGDANASGSVTAADALVALKTSVGSAWCSKVRCDVNLSASVTATDALLLLKASVGSATLPAKCY